MFILRPAAAQKLRGQVRIADVRYVEAFRNTSSKEYLDFQERFFRMVSWGNCAFLSGCAEGGGQDPSHSRAGRRLEGAPDPLFPKAARNPAACRGGGVCLAPLGPPQEASAGGSHAWPSAVPALALLAVERARFIEVGPRGAESLMKETF